jgi:opacity protein-like surface antigen
MKRSVFLAAVLAAIFLPSVAGADDPKGRISFGGGLSAGAIDNEPAIAGSAAYRFTTHFSFEGEVTYVNAAADRFSTRMFPLDEFGGTGVMTRVGSIMVDRRTGRFGPVSGAVFPVPGFRMDAEGNTLVATMGFRYEIPSESARFRPYVSGGLGVARTEETLVLALDSAITRMAGMSRPSISDSVSHTGVAASAGAGASIRVYKELSLDVDARYFRLDRSRNLGRFGGGVSVRF